MIRLSTVAATIFLSVAGAATAADLPTMKSAPALPPPPAYSWTGFYIGVQGGGDWGSSVQTFSGGSTGRYGVSGASVGPTIGYNWEFASHLVLGAEADFSWDNIAGSRGSSTTFNCGITCRTSVDWFATERARLGYAFDNGVLLYGTGGAAEASVRPDLNGFSQSSTRLGWTAGAGVEYAFAHNWSAKLEYLYESFDKYQWTNANNGFFSCSGIHCSTDAKFNVVRAGINYRFW